MTCWEKYRYRDKKSAVSAINERERGRRNNRHNRRPPGSLRAYHCPDCLGWHITHK